MENLEEVGIKGDLKGKEVFLCMDNMVSESISAAGSSELEVILNLVVQLHCLSMRFKLNVRFTHVVGTWMIIQGMDRLFRGDMHEGIMKGKTMLYFLPPEKSSLDRSPALSKWIEGWA